MFDMYYVTYSSKPPGGVSIVIIIVTLQNGQVGEVKALTQDPIPN